MRLSAFIPLVVFVILITALATYLINKPAEKTQASAASKNTQTIVTEVPIEGKATGKKLPYLSLPNLLDINAPLRGDDLKGRYTIVNFFASWCKPCHDEHPLLMALKNEIDIYGIAWQNRYDNTRKFIEKKGNPYKKIGMDLDGRFAIDIGLEAAPETFLLDENGKIIYHHVGALTEEIIETQFKSRI